MTNVNEERDIPEATWWQEKLMDWKPIIQNPCCGLSVILGFVILIIGAIPLFIIPEDDKYVLLRVTTYDYFSKRIKI